MQIEQSSSSRLRWVTFSTEDLPSEGADVVTGLKQTQKQLPARYFYDDQGSALFEQICDLPEYYPTRTEAAILEERALEIAQLTGMSDLVELGSGSSRKTRLLLEAYNRLYKTLQYCPIDVSVGLLKTTALNLLQQYPWLHLCGLAGTYEQALAQLPPAKFGSRLLIFLGSTFGNFNEIEAEHFLLQIQQALKPGEFFLLGVDLVKEISVLEAAYNDSQGVTAEFNLNILQHLNHQFSGNFDLAQFEHFAFFNRAESQIEMHLRSLKNQTVRLEGLNLTVSLDAGETIHTEISRKFHLPTLTEQLEHCFLMPIKVWTDPNKWFGVLLCQRQCINAQECP